MSKFLDQFKAWCPNMSEQDRSEALKVIEEHKKATMQSAQEAGQQVGNALTKAYREAWSTILEKRQSDMAELEEVERMLKAKSVP